MIIGHTDVSNVLNVGLGGLGGLGGLARSAAVAAGVWVWPTLLDGFQGKVARGREEEEKEEKLTNEKKMETTIENQVGC